MTSMASVRAACEVHGQRVPRIHDGYCAGVRWKCAFQQPNDEIIKALEFAFRNTKKSIDRNSSGCGWHRMKDARGRWIRVPYVVIGSECEQGRHRSTMLAIETARYARSKGCTVRIHHDTLYRGAINEQNEQDDRGPCGCYKGAALCQYAQDRSWHSFRQWCVAMERAGAEADAKFDELTERVRKSLGNWTGACAVTFDEEAFTGETITESLPPILPKKTASPALPKANPAYAASSAARQLSVGSASGKSPGRQGSPAAKDRGTPAIPKGKSAAKKKPPVFGAKKAEAALAAAKVDAAPKAMPKTTVKKAPPALAAAETEPVHPPGSLIERLVLETGEPDPEKFRLVLGTGEVFVQPHWDATPAAAPLETSEKTGRVYPTSGVGSNAEHSGLSNDDPNPVRPHWAGASGFSHW